LIQIDHYPLWGLGQPGIQVVFLRPSLDGQGGTALLDYTASKGYLDFAANNKLLGAGMGFWVNKP